MWNKPARNPWKEPDQDSVADKPATASSSDALGNNLGAKRQRRPSVRLEEIGGRPAAFVAEKRKKKTVFFASSREAHQKLQNVANNLEADEPLESDVANSFKAGEVLKAQALAHVNNGHFDEHLSSDDDDGDRESGDRERQTVSHTVLASPCSAMPVESWLERHLALHNANDGNTPPKFLKVFSKRGRNGNRKRGGPKAAASVKQLSCTARSAILSNAERVPCMEDAKDMHSDEENDARTPEGFRDCDLETSDYLIDAKEMSNSQGSKASRGGDLSLLKGECQSRQVSEDGMLRQEQDLVERKNKDLCPSRQVSEEGLLRRDQELLEINKDGGVTTGVWAGTVNRQQTYEPRYDVDTQILTDTSRLHDNKVKLLLEANENEDSREPSDNVDLHLARHRPPLVTGVRGWLQNLGLGKYVQQFEAHEVDSEVLPLLTFDDLKEMGITAVGARRKLFYAIQQLGKCLLVKADYQTDVGL
eukprot:c21806_g1_i1 orf=488-1915(+)